jgi:hypothetical protein
MSKVYCENAPVIYFLFIYKNKIIDFETLSYIYYKEKYVCCNLTFIKKILVKFVVILKKNHKNRSINNRDIRPESLR